MRYVFTSLISVVLVWCAGCDRQAPSVSEAPSLPPERTGVTAPSEPTDSGLALKRGVLALSEERATFKPCGAAAESWVLDQTPQLQTRTLMQQAQAAPAEFYIEAYGELAPALDDPQARGYEHVFVLEEILYAGVPGETRGCDAPDATYIVSARGTEPFWLAEVSKQQVIWRQPDAPTEIVFSAPQTQTAEGGVRYAATHSEHQLELLVHAEPCRDAMSGEFFAYTAKAMLDRKEFNGCARVGE
jgi:uncharacterized membrane protein